MNIALILSGGTGSRMGLDIPKQYVEVKGRSIISYCLETLLEHEEVDRICIVADELWQDFVRTQGEALPKFQEKFMGYAKPGDTRQLSIVSGLEEIRKWANGGDCVMIHDAARPFLSARMISECFAAIQGHDGVLPVLPMKDTVYYSEGGSRVDSLLKRRCIYAGQAPEVFVLEKYYRANVTLSEEVMLGINGSTEPAILSGMDIIMIPGDEKNFKITTKADLERFVQLLDAEV